VKAPVLTLVCLLVGGAACVSSGPVPVKHMREVGTANTVPTADDAVIVFLRPTNEAWAVQASVFEVDESDHAQLVGILAGMKKLVCRVAPGRHLFMAIGEGADFMTAKLEAGKLYYVLVMPEQGAWKANFSLQPVRAAERPQLAERLSKTGWVEATSDSFAWARDNAPDIEAKRFKYYGIWRHKPSFERLALFPDDGR
jgi:hypothetical protein